ncbi:MAG: YmdB family metallophosphoesterase, partial [Bacilli bacterium]|nr:YmdB family metallophosphoesterase [Bacilli bacterium]
MKRYIIVLLILLSYGLAGCEQTIEPDGPETLTIYSINDFHGDVLDEDGNFSVIGNYLMNQKQTNPENTVIISVGDMFQGTAISNMSNGKVVVEMMNEIGFDAMTIGNHEFDWGIEVLSSYRDGVGFDADFPFLSANIAEKATEELVDWAEPYAIVEKGDIKVGIIGLIGQYLTSSISPSIIEPFEFLPEFSIARELAYELRTEHDVDVVILSIHSNTTYDNQAYANLTGDYQIDAVLNGHTHSLYEGELEGTDQIAMPYVQSGSSGSHIGKITLSLDENNVVTQGQAMNLTVQANMAAENAVLSEIMNRYNEEVELIAGEIIGVAGITIERELGTEWAADVIKLATNQDIGLINMGGIRSSGFPIYQNDNITVGDIWEIMPFDNYVKTVKVKAEDIVNVAYSGMQLSLNAYISGGFLY